DVLGADYAMTVSADLLMVSRGERHPTDLAQLHGKRLVVCTESDQGRRLNEGLVKQLTGRDRIRARRMRDDFWEFSPTHKVLLVTYHRPEVRGVDGGIWRRLRLVPFAVTFPLERQDRALPEKLAAESEGVLAWLVRGCLEWQRHGLGEPAAVKTATSE